MLHWLHKYVFANLGTKALALLLALVVYAHVLTSQEREVVFDVPFALAGLPEDVMVVGDIPATVKVRFRGYGVDLIRARVKLATIRLEARVVDARPGRLQRPLVCEDVLIPGDLSVKPIEVVEPKVVSLELDRVVSRSLPVAPSSRGQPAPGYVLFGKVVTKPESVLVRGPAGIVERLQSVPTAPIDATGATADLTRRAPLLVPEGCTCIPEAVTVRVGVEKVVRVRFTDLPVAVHHSSGVRLKSVVPPTGSVSVSGPAAAVELLSRDDLRISIDATTLPAGTYSLPAVVNIKRSARRADLAIEPVEPEKFEVTLE